MYLSLEQINVSLGFLRNVHPFFGTAFLAFKKIQLPVGTTKTVVLTRTAGDLLNKYYRPSSSYQGFYNPFITSDKEHRWNSPRYASTSLQRITADTFREAFIHPKGTSEWGWQSKYVKVLKGHPSFRVIPAFHLGVWLFRQHNWRSGIEPQDVVEYLFEEFDISKAERAELFKEESRATVDDWLSPAPYLERDLLQFIGFPPGSAPEEGGALRRLYLRAIGPSTEFSYEPSDRLNIITGDNSLGKTFLLECVWWALTREWLDSPILPRMDVSKSSPKISYSISAMGGVSQTINAAYNWDKQSWVAPASKHAAVAGLVIYARFDGSYAVWDPVRLKDGNERETIFFGRDDLWYGLSLDNKKTWVCNGILRDWVIWQISGRYQDRWSALVASLQDLSPTDQPLRPGEPVRLPFNDLDIPTLMLPYGQVPIVQGSAGVQRAIGLAYLLVWAWFKHLENSSLVRREPQRRLVLLVDEVEAHLHPRWQRVIVPSLMSTVSHLAPMAAPQLHIATHSPMVMASAETLFDSERDTLHHLKMVKKNVVLEELPFVKRGKADLWLMSDAFGLEHARSLPAEEAIEEAKEVQGEESVDPVRVREVHSRLIRALAQDDEFWPRWRYFAKQHGITQ